MEELLECLQAAGVETLVDIRRFPGSRRHPQFGREALAASLSAAGVRYHHAEGLGGRRPAPPDGRFAGMRARAFAGYAAWMGTPGFEAALAEALALPAPCLMCAETVPWRCHRLLVSDLLVARGHEVYHLMRPHESRRHALSTEAEVRDGCLWLAGDPVAPAVEPTGRVDNRSHG